MRIGTWNMRKYPLPTSDKGPCITEFLDREHADIWLFTEVNAGWKTSHDRFAVSPQRKIGRPQDRWAGIQTRFDITQLSDGSEGPAAAEEALCLARVELPESAGFPSVLVACSVLPWEGAAEDWPDLPCGFFDDHAAFVLEHHVARIEAAQRPGEPVIWGGDFNQELKRLPPERTRAGFRLAGTVRGIGRLRAAFDRFELRALTEDAEHRIEGAGSIDHLAVSHCIASGTQVEVHRPTCPDGRLISDHAAYIAEVGSEGRRPRPASRA